VLGRLQGKALDEAADTVVEDVMEEGPTTVRASEDLLELATRLGDHGVASILVTDPDGRLLGIVFRDDADALLCREEQAARR
jgi:CBS domain-containing protein